MAEPVASCRHALLAAARSFRLGMDAQGHEAFVRFLDALQVVLTNPAATGAAAALAPHLGPLLEAQQRADTLRMADLLEFVVLPCLGEEPGGAFPR